MISPSTTRCALRLTYSLALNQEACDAYCWDLKPNAWIVVDRDLITHPPTSRAIALPFTAVARDKLKRIMVANVVALGAISELTGIVTRRSLERSLLSRVPRGTEELNKKALSLGVKLVRHTEGQNDAEESRDPGVEST